MGAQSSSPTSSSTTPVVRQIQVRRTNTWTHKEGCDCCGVCRVCTCFKWGVIATPAGVLKATQFVRLRNFQMIKPCSTDVRWWQSLNLNDLYFILISTNLSRSLVLFVSYCSSGSAWSTPVSGGWGRPTWSSWRSARPACSTLPSVWPVTSCHPKLWLWCDQLFL